MRPVADLLNLAGQTVLVTGASGGIGSGIAARLAEAGARVIVQFQHNEAAAQQTVRDIQAAGGKAKPLHAALTDDGAGAALVAQSAQWGDLTALVNAAGIQPVASFADITRQDLTTMLQTNLAAPFALMQAFAAHRGPRGGVIVNIASIEALQPAVGHCHYATAKAALIMATKAAALELGALNIRVNAVSPGLIHRDGIEDGWPEGVARWQAAAPLQRLGTPQDIADAVLFLISDAARWITGANLIVDGGVSAGPNW